MCATVFCFSTFTHIHTHTHTDNTFTQLYTQAKRTARSWTASLSGSIRAKRRTRERTLRQRMILKAIKTNLLIHATLAVGKVESADASIQGAGMRKWIDFFLHPHRGIVERGGHKHRWRRLMLGCVRFNILLRTPRLSLQ